MRHSFRAIHLIIMAVLVLAVFAGCDRIKELTGTGVDNEKIAENCKTLQLGMSGADMVSVMGKAVYEREGQGEEENLRHYIFTSASTVKVPVIVSVDTRDNLVVKIQCAEGFIKSSTGR